MKSNTTSKDNRFATQESTKYRKYIDFKVDGKLFPTWVLHNLKKYTLPEVIKDATKDPCIRPKDTKKKLRLYQEFIIKYLDYEGPYKNLLLYHGLGSGKTAITINVYNMLFNYTPGWNVFILIRAALKNDPWIQELDEWLQQDDKDIRYKNIKFIHYDSPFADRDFMDAVKETDASKKSFYIIDEAHNFIRNVYSNISSKSGKRALNIYNYIKQDVVENDSTRVVLISGTPAVNEPYELALIFNLLRPGIFPDSSNKFNQMYVSTGAYNTINPLAKNKFMRKIIGLVSYYIGATPDTHATSTVSRVDIVMDKYQEDVYKYYEDIEIKIEAKRKIKGSGSKMYKSYTRQASNFVFPQISQKINGESRPRPHAFKISEKEALALETGKDIKLKAEKHGEKFMNVTSYIETLNLFLNSFRGWLDKKDHDDISNKWTLRNDVESFVSKNITFKKFWKTVEKKSSLLQAMYMCSPKFVYIIMNTLRSPGPSVMYTNYVKMEGIDIMKIYLRSFGFTGYGEEPKGKYCFGEFHGGITDRDERQKTKLAFNSIENIKGNVIKIILFSPAGTEGISLANVRQMHITEPYWNEVRIKQMIGRAIRQCSHKDLPMDQRHVEIFRYKMILSEKGSETRISTDQYIEELARSKDNLLQSFYMTLKEIAVDCELNKAHNMMNTEYTCFKFDENAVFDKHVGPAYKEDDYDDDRIDSGSYSINSVTKRIKVLEIKAVKIISAKKEGDVVQPIYSEPVLYWYYPETNVIYDHKLKYPIGKIGVDENNLPMKLDRDTYIITKMNPIAEREGLFD
jgi:superfamily II DNA or RNA helicase